MSVLTFLFRDVVPYANYEGPLFGNSSVIPPTQAAVAN